MTIRDGVPRAVTIVTQCIWNKSIPVICGRDASRIRFVVAKHRSIRQEKHGACAKSSGVCKVLPTSAH